MQVPPTSRSPNEATQPEKSSRNGTTRIECSAALPRECARRKRLRRRERNHAAEVLFSSEDETTNRWGGLSPTRLPDGRIHGPRAERTAHLSTASLPSSANSPYCGSGLKAAPVAKMGRGFPGVERWPVALIKAPTPLFSSPHRGEIGSLPARPICRAGRLPEHRPTPVARPANSS
jgi:hypothetical protein